MKVIVVGLGSMGKRRIRLLKAHFDINDIIGVDTNEERRRFCESEYDIKTAESIKEAFDGEKADVAFVCTSPLSHANIITECLECGANVFTEINLVSEGYEKNIRLAEEKNLKLFMSSTPVYRDEMKYLRTIINSKEEKVCYTYHVGQYLPDWHPWENFKDFFVGDKRTNGCREIFAIELPWLQKTFGKITEYTVNKQRLLNIGLDYDDCYTVLFKHENGNMGTFIVDVVSRVPVRELRIIGENTFITWNGTADSLYGRDDSGEMRRIDLYEDIEQNAAYNPTIVENGYVNEIRQFFDELIDNKDAQYTFEEDKVTLQIIDGIEKETND